MCSRYSLTSPPEAVRSYFGYRDRPNFPPRYNIAPTQPIAIVRMGQGRAREFALVRWGLIPAWVKDPRDFATLINARSETALEKPAFRNAARRRRCLVPANGFYEWTGPKGHKRPFYLHAPESGLIAFAGLWEHWQGADGSELESATILTRDANALVRPLHDRMPALVAREDFAAWLDSDSVAARDAFALLRPVPDDWLRAVEVRPKINDPRLEGPDVRTPLEGDLLP